MTGREQMSESVRVVKVMPCPGRIPRPCNFPGEGEWLRVRARMRSVRVPLAGWHKGDEASETE